MSGIHALNGLGRTCVTMATTIRGKWATMSKSEKVVLVQIGPCNSGP